MANIKSRMKRIRTNEEARLRNRSAKFELKTFVCKTRETVVTGGKTAAESALRIATRRLDAAASKGIIHKNQAAQRKFKLVTSVATMSWSPV